MEEPCDIEDILSAVSEITEPALGVTFLYREYASFSDGSGHCTLLVRCSEYGQEYFRKMMSVFLTGSAGKRLLLKHLAEQGFPEANSGDEMRLKLAAWSEDRITEACGRCLALEICSIEGAAGMRKDVI